MIGLAVLYFEALAAASADWKKKEPKLGEWESSDDVDENGRRMQKLQIQSPNLTEEDQSGVTLPKQYECSACRAIIYQTESALKKTVAAKKVIKEWDLIDIFDKVCTTETFNDYGISTVDGANLLTGPGIEKEELQTGSASIKMGGGKWPDHLRRMCLTMISDKEEDIYSLFKEKKQIDKDAVCGTDLFTYCKKTQEKAKAKAEQKKNASEKRKDTKKKEKEAKKLEKEKQKRDEKNRKISVAEFLLEQEKQLNAPYASFSSARSSEEWGKLFTVIAQSLKPKKRTDEL